MKTLSEKEKTAQINITKDTVLFVCTGNTCRSPMCAALYNAKHAGLTSVGISAGLCADGSIISDNAVLALQKYGIKSSEQNDYISHVSRNVTREMVQEAKLVIGLTSAHAMALIMRYPEFASKITSFAHDIPDPFGGEIDVYKLCLSSIDAALNEMFAKDIGEENGAEDNKSNG